MQKFQELTRQLSAIPSFFDISNSLTKHSRFRYSTRRPSQVDRVVLHHSASKGMSIDDIARFHVRENKWPGIGYHIVINQDGTGYLVNKLDLQSYHCKGNNFRSIGICVNDNCENQVPTEKAEHMLCQILTVIALYFHEVDIFGHKELGSTKCPGSLFPLAEMKYHYKSIKQELFIS
jgi:N-acetylmuramoyl-L-alanine amidase